MLSKTNVAANGSDYITFSLVS